MTTVSVVIPTRNSARTLLACLTSIQAQTYRPIEVIVVDNSSTDGSLAMAQQFTNSAFISGPERSAQRNFGARNSSGDYLLFVDSDMVLRGDVVAACVSCIERTTAPAVIIPEITIGQGFWARCRAMERSCYADDDLIEAARFFRRKSFNECGGFDESLTGPEDWDLTARISPGKTLPRASAYIVHDEGNIVLRDHLAKKRYYSQSLVRYAQKHRHLAVRQSNLLFRPAFVRNWRRFLSDPVTGAGLITMKSLEVVAAARGVLSSRKQGAKHLRHSDSGPAH